MRRGVVLTLAVAALGLSACSDDGDDDRLVGVWVPTAFVDGDRTVELDPPAEGAFLHFEADGSVSGHDGCNGFGYDSYRVGDGRITFDRAQFSTLVDCFDRPLETRFRAVRDGTIDYSIDGDRLVLTTSNRRGIVFTAEHADGADPVEDEQAIVGTRWTILGYLHPDREVLVDPSGEDSFIVFEADGTVTGNDGCNDFDIGSYEVEDGRIHLGGELLRTIADCGLPELHVDSFEAILRGSVDYELADGELRLRADDRRGVLFTADG